MRFIGVAVYGFTKLRQHTGSIVQLRWHIQSPPRTVLLLFKGLFSRPSDNFLLLPKGKDVLVLPVEEVHWIPFPTANFDSNDVGTSDELLGVIAAHRYELNIQLGIGDDIGVDVLAQTHQLHVDILTSLLVVNCIAAHRRTLRVVILLNSDQNDTSVAVQKRVDCADKMEVMVLFPRVPVVLELKS